MGLHIRTKQTPFRVSLNRKEHSELFITITNNGSQAEKASLVINTGRQLALDSSGLRNYHEWRMDGIEPGAEKHLYIDVFPKQSTEIGENPFQLVLTEFHESWDLVKKQIVLDETVLVQK